MQVDPRHLRRNTPAPPVAIERVLVDGKPLPISVGPAPGAASEPAGVPLCWHELCGAEAVRYRLPHWGLRTPTGSTPRGGAAPSTPTCRRGRYTFRVMAANNDGVWSARDGLTLRHPARTGTKPSASAPSRPLPFVGDAAAALPPAPVAIAGRTTRCAAKWRDAPDVARGQCRVAAPGGARRSDRIANRGAFDRPCAKPESCTARPAGRLPCCCATSTTSRRTTTATATSPATPP